jgi:hypothetical protein
MLSRSNVKNDKNVGIGDESVNCQSAQIQSGQSIEPAPRSCPIKKDADTFDKYRPWKNKPLDASKLDGDRMSSLPW